MNLQQYINYVNNQPNTEEAINKRLSEFTSTDIFNKYLGRPKIIKYSELNKYNDLDELLPNINDYVIILIEAEENIGHWVALLKYKIKDDIFIEWVDSYGMVPATGLKYNSDYTNRLLGNDINKIFELLENEKYNKQIIYNKSRLQELDNNIATCGRHVIFRILCFKFFNANLYEYLKIMNNLKQKFNISADEVVAMLII
jgi:hypothetical protein